MGSNQIEPVEKATPTCSTACTRSSNAGLINVFRYDCAHSASVIFCPSR
jgi:hypothetical protein